jgi:hypothetical protein
MSNRNNESEFIERRELMKRGDGMRGWHDDQG